MRFIISPALCYQKLIPVNIKNSSSSSSQEEIEDHDSRDEYYALILKHAKLVQYYGHYHEKLRVLTDTMKRCYDTIHFMVKICDGHPTQFMNAAYTALLTTAQELLNEQQQLKGVLQTLEHKIERIEQVITNHESHDIEP